MHALKGKGKDILASRTSTRAARMSPFPPFMGPATRDLDYEQSLIFLTDISINLLVFYHDCCNLIGYSTHYLFL